VYAGKVAGDLAAVAAGTATLPRGPLYYAMVGAGLASTVAVTIFATQLVRRAIDAEMRGTTAPSR
jgi:hypothetical protein